MQLIKYVLRVVHTFKLFLKLMYGNVAVQYIKV